MKTTKNKKTKKTKEEAILAVSDKKHSQRHLAKFVLLANTHYVDQDNNIIKMKWVQVARCFTRRETYKFIDEIKLIKRPFHNGYDNNGPIYEERTSKAYPFTMVYLPSGETVTEKIKGFKVLEVSEYLNNLTEENV